MTAFRFLPLVRRCLQALPCAFLFAVMSGTPQPAAAQAEREPEWAAPVDTSANLFRVTPTLYRGAKLNRKDIALMQSLGIKTIVSLRAFHSDEKLLKDSGIKTVRVRLYTWDIEDRQVVDALRAIRTAELDGPVLVHCQHGADRTGLIAAMYRILYQRWSKEEAMDELMHGGYGYHSLWKNIQRYIRRVDVEKLQRLVDQE